MRNLLIILAFLASPVSAQNIVSGAGVLLRTLDKVSGEARDLELRTMQSAQFGSLSIYLRDCRYPAGNPNGNAYASLEIVEDGESGALFSGWMIASTPGLSALEHYRYDVWVIRCITS